jgi:D-threo-aldose 1-dehydrogenase
MDVSTPRQVGKSAMRVTPLGFGGGIMSRLEVSNEQALATVKAAWDSGVRFFETSPCYGVGRSKRRLGLALIVHCPFSGHCPSYE